jgi:hypothetical protein
MSGRNRPPHKNALKSGVAATGWLDPQEQASYNAYVQELESHYQPLSAILRIQIDRLATNLVRRDRLHRVENALYEKSRLAHAQVLAHPAPNSVSGAMPKTSEEQARALTIVRDAALPDLERSELLTRYITGLERQISKLIQEIEAMRTQSRPAARTALGTAGDGLIMDVSAVART